ncbi:hypothetical protein ACE1BS_14110, partial [Aeromonas jandaei]
KCEVSPEKRGGWSKKADFGVNTSEFWSNENFKREQAGYDEGAIHLFAPSLDLYSRLVRNTICVCRSVEINKKVHRCLYRKTPLQ